MPQRKKVILRLSPRQCPDVIWIWIEIRHGWKITQFDDFPSQTSIQFGDCPATGMPTQVAVEAADDTPRWAIRAMSAAMNRNPERGKPMKMDEMENGPQQFTAIHVTIDVL